MKKNKKRKGVIAIVITLFLFATMLLSVMIVFSFDKAAYAKREAERTTDTTSYMSMCNVLANGFKNDLENSWCTIVTGNLLDVGKTPLEFYSEALQNIQNSIIGPDYMYVITDPKMIINENTLSLSDAAIETMNRLLDNAEMEITLDTPITISMVKGPYSDTSEIEFTVTLAKGLHQYTQHYILSQEIIVSAFDGENTSVTRYTIDGSSATLTLDSQSIEFRKE